VSVVSRFFRSARQRQLPSLRAPSRKGATALILDTETTGLSHRDEVIEIGLLLLQYDPRTGQLGQEIDNYHGLREPSVPIHWAAARVHGLSLRQLRGKRLDGDKVMHLIEVATVVVAHNATFDRRFVARHFPAADSASWKCSCRGINWRGHGFASASLPFLLRAHQISSGGAHRALADATALAGLLRCGRYFPELLGVIS
jgi:DNA polymerase III subunit epsilon